MTSSKLLKPALIAAALTFGALALLALLADPGSTASPHGEWLAEDIDGGGVIANARTTINIARDGIVTGSGGCNRYAGSAAIDDSAIKFLPMASTRMACPTPAMRQESKFHATLEKIRGWRIEKTKLVLLDKDGFELMRLGKTD